MSKTRKDQTQVDGKVEKQILKVEVADAVDLSALPLETVEDYQKYAEEARKQRKPIKFIPSSMFPSQKVKFRRVDNQKGSPAKVRFRSGKHLLDFKKDIKDGEILDMPTPVIEYINSRQVDRYKQVKYADGSYETVYSHSEPRFSCQPVYED